jgi:hypothetical protein
MKQEAGMRLTMQETKKVVAIVAARYQRARKKQKGIILTEFIELTGYDRCYASYVLRNHGKKMRVKEDTVLQGDIREKTKRKRQKTYDGTVKERLTKIWGIMDCICGKRLAPMLKEVIRVLECHKEMRIDRAIRKKLCRISPATIDRLLAEERKK